MPPGGDLSRVPKYWTMCLNIFFFFFNLIEYYIKLTNIIDTWFSNHVLIYVSIYNEKSKHILFLERWRFLAQHCIYEKKLDKMKLKEKKLGPPKIG